MLVGLGLGLGDRGRDARPVQHRADGHAMPYVPPGQLAAILGGAAVLGMVGSQLPTRLALRAKAVDAIGVRG